MSVTTSNPSNSQRLMVALARDVRERVSQIAHETCLSESRIAAELIAKGLGRKTVITLPTESEGEMVNTMTNKEIELLNEALRWLEPDEENELLKAIARDYARRDPQRFESMLRSSFATVTDGEAIEDQ
jgi:predicted transcriptional regulator